MLKTLALAMAAAAALGSLAPARAQATTLSGILTADNLFTAYLSTDDSVLGAAIVSGSDWTHIYAFPATSLTPGVTNYLHVIAQDQGEVFMFEGDFSLSDTHFHFGNGAQDLLSNTTNWTADLYSSGWTAPTGTPVSLGSNPLCCTPWGNADMTAGAGYIWAAGGHAFSSAAFSTPIFSDASSGAPEPSAWALAVLGFFSLGAALRRRQMPAEA